MAKSNVKCKNSKRRRECETVPQPDRNRPNIPSKPHTALLRAIMGAAITAFLLPLILLFADRIIPVYAMVPEPMVIYYPQKYFVELLDDNSAAYILTNDITKIARGTFLGNALIGAYVFRPLEEQAMCNVRIYGNTYVQPLYRDHQYASLTEQIYRSSDLVSGESNLLCEIKTIDESTVCIFPFKITRQLSQSELEESTSPISPEFLNGIESVICEYKPEYMECYPATIVKLPNWRWLRGLFKQNIEFGDMKSFRIQYK